MPEAYEMLAQKIGKEKDESWEDLLVSEKRSTLLGRIGRELWISRQSGRIGGESSFG